MLLMVIENQGDEFNHNNDRLIYVLANAIAHGVNRVDPEPYTCDCGLVLWPGELDHGDRLKTSWPDAVSWRDGGRRKCPQCEEYPSTSRDGYFRTRGYEVPPKSEIKSITAKQRREALEDADHTCKVCDDEAEYVKRMVPPRYGGNRDPVNLVALCEHHHEDPGHMFGDLLFPAEWHLLNGVEWRAYAEAIRDKYAEMKSPEFPLVEALDTYLARGMPENPYPYIDFEESASGRQ